MKKMLWIAMLPAAVVVALTFALMSSPIAPKADPQASLDALEAIRSRRRTVLPGSAGERKALERFRGLFSDFTAEGLRSTVPNVYADDVFFNDTVKTILSVGALTEYLTHSAETVISCEVRFLNEIQHDGDYFFHWLMEIQFRGADRGRATRSAGVSHIRFDEEGKVVYHQDYWDSATGLYQHLPVVGWLIRKIRARL